MKTALHRTFAVLALSLFAAGCSAQGDFPSLAPRPIELSTNQPAGPAPAPPVLPSNPQLLARTDEALRLAQASMSAFDAALSSAKSAARESDGTRGSERWVAAQMALSALERTRAPAATAMADLDDARRILLMGSASADVAAVEAAWAKVQDIYQSQMEASQAVAVAVNRR